MLLESKKPEIDWDDVRAGIRHRLHDVEGWLVAIERRNETFQIVSEAENWDSAISDLEAGLDVTREQAEQIVGLHLGRFTRQQVDRFEEERRVLIEKLEMPRLPGEGEPPPAGSARS